MPAVLRLCSGSRLSWKWTGPTPEKGPQGTSGGGHWGGHRRAGGWRPSEAITEQSPAPCGDADRLSGTRHISREARWWRGQERTLREAGPSPGPTSNSLSRKRSEHRPRWFHHHLRRQNVSMCKVGHYLTATLRVNGAGGTRETLRGGCGLEAQAGEHAPVSAGKPHGTELPGQTPLRG